MRIGSRVSDPAYPQVFYDTDSICERVRQKIFIHTSGIVFLTVVVNAISYIQAGCLKRFASYMLLLARPWQACSSRAGHTPSAPCGCRSMQSPLPAVTALATAR